jgi:hypothetical protein
MADEKHLLLTIQGTVAGTGLEEETWQCGIRWALNWGDGSVAPAGTLNNNWNPVAAVIGRDETDWTITGNWSVDGPLVDTFSADDWLNDQVAPALYDWMVGTKQSGNVRINALSVYPIGAPSGRSVPAAPYTTGSPVTLQYKSPYGAGTSTGLLPLQCSIVCSHRTAQVGRAGRGRIFLPPTGTSTTSNGLIGATACQDIADAHAAFLEACVPPGGLSDLELRPIVTGGNWTKYAVINAVEVGNVVDTQRRRRKSIQETRYSASTTY